MSGDDAEARRGDWALFFGRNGERMSLLRYSRHPFCWPGFLFPQAWFLYRKMYLWAALVSVGPFLIGFFPRLAWLNWSTSLVGAMGLRLYFASARATIERIRTDAANEDEAQAQIARAGGVSRLGAAIGTIFVFAVFVLSLKAGAHLGFHGR